MDVNTNTAMFDLFNRIFCLGNRMQYVVDTKLQDDGLTAKQFLMIAAIDKLFAAPPSLGEVADVLNTSHQNARQLANQLCKKGFMKIVKDGVIVGSCVSYWLEHVMFQEKKFRLKV